MATGEEHKDPSPPRLPPLSLSRQRSVSAFQISFSPSPNRQPSPIRQLSPSPVRRAPLEHAQSLDSVSFARLNSQASFSSGSSTLARSPSIARSRIPKVYNSAEGAAATPAASGGAASLVCVSSPESTGSFTSQASRKNLLRSQSSFSLRGLEPETFNGGARKKRGFQKRAMRIMILVSFMIVGFFVCDWLALGYLHQGGQDGQNYYVYTTTRLDGMWSSVSEGNKHTGVMYERLLALAAHALAETEYQDEAEDLWGEPVKGKWVWKPCADQRSPSHDPPHSRSTGYIVVSANGGLNQQRVAVCNAVAVARLLNATLVLPTFLFNSVWMDDSQFSDIYDEDYFMEYLKEDVNIVKELPAELRSLDLEAIGSLVTDLEIMKESKPSFYVNNILPILLKNRVVHFSGFGNRLSFDPIPSEIQRLRCLCNFHALRFVPKLQRTADLLVDRIRRNQGSWGWGWLTAPMRYVGLHLRFEMDMVAHSLCEFGGGESERKELEAYRHSHFPLLMKQEQELRKRLSAAERREQGWCPMTPEETVVMLAALGFKRRTRIFLAGAGIYGGQSRMAALTSMYPNLVTKEDLLTQAELAPFKGHSSQLAALDFLACVAADVFTMSDSGSQLASQVTGQRMYWGAGRLPTIRPNKKRLAGIFAQSTTIEWDEFQESVRKAVRESKRMEVRPTARSVYRHPRCIECMCVDKTLLSASNITKTM